MKVPALLLGAVALAGCIASPGPEPMTASTGAPTPEPAASWAEAAWEGRILVHATQMPSMHPVTAPLLEPVDRQVARYTLSAAPERMQLRVAWTPPEAPLFLNAVGPPTEEGDPPREHHSEETTGGALCIELPREEAMPGGWRLMVHGTPGAADVAFTLTVALLGGEGAFDPDAAPPGEGGGGPGQDVDNEGAKRPCPA